MKIIRDPETCPLCDYSRQGLEPGRVCPECGLSLLPDAPVLDLSISRRWVRLLIRWCGMMGVTAFLFSLLGLPPAPSPIGGYAVALGSLALGAALGIGLALKLFRIHMLAVFSLELQMLVRRGRVRWRLPYGEIVSYKRDWLRGRVVLRRQGGTRRYLPTRTHKDQMTIIWTIDEVLARYRKGRAPHSATRAAGFSLRDGAASKASPQSEE